MKLGFRDFNLLSAQNFSINVERKCDLHGFFSSFCFVLIVRLLSFSLSLTDVERALCHGRARVFADI